MLPLDACRDACRGLVCGLLVATLLDPHFGSGPRFRKPSIWKRLGTFEGNARPAGWLFLSLFLIRVCTCFLCNPFKALHIVSIQRHYLYIHYLSHIVCFVLVECLHQEH